MLASFGKAYVFCVFEVRKICFKAMFTIHPLLLENADFHKYRNHLLGNARPPEHAAWVEAEGYHTLTFTLCEILSEW